MTDRDRLSDLFEAARGLSGDEREAFLDRVLSNQPTRRRLLERLLREDRRASEQGLLTGAHRANVLAAPRERHPGELIGRYEVVELLGRGGMGDVYLARWADRGLDKLVALKLLPGSVAEPGPLTEFPLEGQIQARLDHPFIAMLLDAGFTEEGEPYLVLENVPGDHIDRYCDDQRLDLSARIRLFIEVCETVQYAHGYGVLHQDLKPSNVLVTPEGKPKLLDFGVAVLLDRAGLGEVSVAGTPGYASPELLRGEPTSASSDVYSLGILLHKLLFAGEAHDDPEVPPEPNLDNPAQARSSARSKLSGQWRGDLGAIVRKASAPNRDNRYATVAELTADLRSFLSHRPVTAMPGGRPYRMRRAFRRHWLEVSAALALLIMATVGAAAVWQQSRQAQAEREIAERLNDLLTGIFADADPLTPPVGQLTAGELLRRAAKRLRSEALGPPLLQARLDLALGESFVGLGAYGEAEPLLEGACPALEAAGRGEEARALECRFLLANLLYRLGRLAEAENHLRDLHALSPHRARRHPTLVGRAASDLALVLGDLGRPDEAETLMIEAISRFRAGGGAAAASLSDALTVHGRFLIAHSRFEEATAAFEEALELRERVLGSSHPHTGQALNNLGELHRALGRLGPAREALERALAIRLAALGEDHPDVATTLSNLGLVEYSEGKLEAASERLEAALSLARRTLGGEHSTYAVILNNLAAVHFQRYDLDRAEALFAESLELVRSRWGAEHSETARGLHNLATILQLRERYAEAEDLYRQALAIRRASFGDRHVAVAQTLDSLGVVLILAGQLPEARRLLDEALETRRALLPEGHPDIGRTLMAQGRLELAAHNGAAAGAPLEEAQVLLREGLGPESRDAALATSLLGEALLATGEVGRARDLLVSSAHSLRSHYPPDARALREAEARLARLELGESPWRQGVAGSGNGSGGSE